jgi:hypothetical protein
MAYFPTSPVDGEPVTVNGILYTYNASKGAWKRAVSSINNLSVAGNITAAGNISAGNVSVTNKVAAGAIYTTSGLFWAGNGVAFSSFPTELDANVGTLFLGNISTQANLGAFQTYANANIGTLFLANASTNANLGAFQTYANTTFTSYSNNNVSAYLTLGANIGSGSTTANLVAAATTTSTSTTTGALVVRGGAGIAGNVFADKFYTSSGIFWSGNGAAYASGGGGGSFTASASAPVSPALGSFWYKTTTDVLYEYINDGVSNYWIDIQTQTIASNTAGVSTFAGTVFGANITFTGSITGTVGYLIERANVVARAPPAVTNIDLITAPILYFTSNTTQNITANIRGNSTTTLNSLLSIGQSTTFVIFVPNATAYYVNTVRVDNTVVNPYWQGGFAIAGGNANCIDIYTFAVLKTANATFKVFASQVKYQNLGP